MTISHLGADDVAWSRRCMDFIARSRSLDGAFATRLGIEPNQLAKMLLRWPEGIESTEWTPTTIAVHNAFNEMINGLDLSDSDLQAIGANREAVRALWLRWSTVRGATPDDPR